MKKILFISLFLLNYFTTNAQLFPNPVTLGTGYNISPCTGGTSTDPLWLVYAGTTSAPVITPANYTTGFAFTPAKVNCSPCGGWAANQTTYHWISPTGICTDYGNTKKYYIYRLPLTLPQTCGQNIDYSITFNGYVDDKITNIYVNGVATGISTNVSQQWLNAQTITLNSGWIPGINYIDIVVYNSGGGVTGLQFAVSSIQNNNQDSDNDGIADLFDQCPCETGNNSVGCVDPNFTCDVDLIRSTFVNAGCQELNGCWDDCSMYFLNPQYLTGSAAQSFAQTYGANLISIQSASENACILNDLNRLGYASGDVIWIGFNDEAVEGQFTWYDQSPVVYTNWATGEPNNSGGNEDCVQIYPGGSQPGTWNDLNCGGYNSMSIIEVNLCPVTTITPPITICQEQNANVGVVSTILGSAPYTYSWSNGFTQPTQNLTPMVTTEYSVIVTDRYSCTVKDTTSVIVNLKPTAAFSSTVACSETASVNFTNESSVADNSVLSSSWDFGNGQTSTATNPTNVFPTFGSHNATLIVSTTHGCKDTITNAASVLAKPTADFTFDAPCNAQGNVTMQNSSSSPDGGSVNSQWTYNNGQTSTTTNPVLSFTNPVNNSVTLIVSTGDNCKDTITKLVTSNISPIADFTVTPGCIGEELQMTNSSSITDNSNLQYAWDFGNGQTSTQKNPTTSYTTSGNHSITLIVTGGNGCSDTMTIQATVFAQPLADFTVSSNCVGENIQINNTSTISDNSNLQYTWNFGNNQTSTQVNPITNYSTNGDYTVTLIATSTNGCKDTVIHTSTAFALPTADFTFDATCNLTGNVTLQNASSGPNGSTISNLWTYNSGQTSTDNNPVISLSDPADNSVTLIVSTTDNCKDTITKEITSNVLPVADFTVSSACVGSDVQINNTSSIADNSNLQYTWDFGNGQNSTQTNPTTSYLTDGDYIVKLIVSSENGCKDSVTHTTTAFALPIADFTFATPCNTQGNVMMQNGSSSPDGGSVNSLWVYNNGQTSTTTNPTISFTNPTNNPVTLIVTTANNCKDTITKLVTSNISPIADFSVAPDCVGENIQVINSSSIADNSTLQYTWNLGNGQTSTQVNPTTSYATSGNATITLVVSGGSGCKDTLSKDVSIYPIPETPIITSNSPVMCPGDVFNFEVNPLNGATYFWSGPGNFLSQNRQNSLTAALENVGTYSASISVNGCPSDTAEVSLIILSQASLLNSELPNIVTPNGDGKNDQIDITDYLYECAEFKMQIFNRWGNSVWIQSNGGSAFTGKDGSGNELSDGVYFYKLSFGKEERTGFITIVR